MPNLRLTFFAPFLILMIYRKSIVPSLWIAFLCGLFLDLLATGMRLGLFALNYTLTILLLFQFKRYFFADRLSTLPLMTYFFAMTSTTLQALLQAIFERGNLLSWHWIITDLIALPLCDALFCFCFFALPRWRQNELATSR